MGHGGVWGRFEASGPGGAHGAGIVGGVGEQLRELSFGDDLAVEEVDLALGVGGEAAGRGSPCKSWRLRREARP